MSWLDLFKTDRVSLNLSPDEIKRFNKQINEEEKQKKEEQRLLKQKAERNSQEKAKREKEKAQKELFDRNKDLIEKFLQIAERKVSIIDDYGDENWEILPSEILTCLKKIANREKKDIDWKRYAKHMLSLHAEYDWLSNELKNAFHAYHTNQQARLSTIDDVSTMTGIEFETWVVKLLKENGFEDIRGTPITGDQGADIIVNKDGRRIVIQAKRYKGTVGNKAVQEVIGALQYYDGNEGWVITNSTFTPSAIALAQKSKIILIDREAIVHIEDFINCAKKKQKKMVEKTQSVAHIPQDNYGNVNYCISLCEYCRQKLRIPIKKELLKITCPACRNIFYFHNGKQTYDI